MSNAFKVHFLIFLSFFLSGCPGPDDNKPSIENIKITDLAPSNKTGKSRFRALNTINFNVYVIEVPSEKTGVLDEIRKGLYTQPLMYNDQESFKVSLFSAGFGQFRMWGEISRILEKGNGRVVEVVSLLLPDGRYNDIEIARLEGRSAIYYKDGKGHIAGGEVGYGKLVLRIKAVMIPGSRGVCKLTALPVFIPDRFTEKAVNIGKSKKVVYESAGFGAKMGSGDFLFLAPIRPIDDQVTLGGLFFSRKNIVPITRAYLIVCTRIID